MSGYTEYMYKYKGYGFRHLDCSSLVQDQLALTYGLPLLVVA